MTPEDMLHALPTARDPQALVTQIEERAAAGDRDAIGVAWQLYCDGVRADSGRWIVRKNARAARRYLERGAALNDPGLMTVLAGELVDNPKTFRRAVLLYKKAFTAGYEPAAYNLANHHRRNQQYRSAYNWFVKAADAGDENGLFDVAMMELYGVGTRRDVPSALKKLAKVARSNTWYWPSHFMQIDAMLTLAHVHDEGLLVKRDFAAAERWREKAAALGSVVARAHLDNVP